MEVLNQGHEKVELPRLSVIQETMSNLEGEMSMFFNSARKFPESPQVKAMGSFRTEGSPDYAVSQLMASMIRNSKVNIAEEKQPEQKSKDPSNGIFN